MLIKYQPKYEHIKCVPLIPITDEQKKITLTRSQVQLLPGVNEVTDGEWKVMQSHLVREIARKEITIIEKEVTKGKKNPTGGKVHDLKDMPIKDAINLVTESVSPDTLIKWHKEEPREEVRLVIVEKMKELKMEIPKYTPNENGDDDDNTLNGNGNGGKNLDDMTVEELKAYAEEKGIEVSGNKAEILAAIKEAEAK